MQWEIKEVTRRQKVQKEGKKKPEAIRLTGGAKKLKEGEDEAGRRDSDGYTV